MFKHNSAMWWAAIRVSIPGFFGPFERDEKLKQKAQGFGKILENNNKN